MLATAREEFVPTTIERVPALEHLRALAEVLGADASPDDAETQLAEERDALGEAVEARDKLRDKIEKHLWHPNLRAVATRRKRYDRSMDRMTVEDFEAGCRQCISAAPSCRGWSLAFHTEDFEREWYVTARSGTVESTVMVASASATASQVSAVIAELGKMLEELRSGVVDATASRVAILRELGATL